jgi:flagellar secretion chaperone FliS
MLKNAKQNPIAQSKLRLKARRPPVPAPHDVPAQVLMMQANQASSAYRRASTAVPPLVAIVRLLDAAIVNLKQSIEAIEVRKLDVGHSHMTRATAILRGLKYHLDFDKGGALAERVANTYTRLILSILRAYGKPDVVECYKKIILALTDMRDAWLSVVRVSAPTTVASRG